MSDDPKLSQRYRELPREEPPRALDDAILAASRRAVQRRRWSVPLAAAAVITLAAAVTLHVQHDRPGEEIDAVSPSMRVQEVPKPEAPKAAAEAPRASPRELRRDSTGFTPDPASQSGPARSPQTVESAAAESAEKQGTADIQRAPAPQASAPAPAAAPVDAAKAAGARASRGEQARAETRVASVTAEPSPEIQLERIARLRAAGRHEEADKALAEFRKRYPDYRLSDETKAKVERR